jgi:hypothetical protein
MQNKRPTTFYFIFFTLILFILSACSASANPAIYNILEQSILAAGAGACGEKVLSSSIYQQISLYSVIAGFGFLVGGIFSDKKALKFALFSLSLVGLGAWSYIHFGINFDKVNRQTFTYNIIAEQTLANIAEAQDRYKSEYDTYLKDLNKLYSHMAGSHGIDQCVDILKIEATWNEWTAVAKHVSSPEKVTWTSKNGSSLKKG